MIRNTRSAVSASPASLQIPSSDKRRDLKDLLYVVLSEPRRQLRKMTAVSLAEIARSAFKERPVDLAFLFRGSNGKVIACARNLHELVTILNDIPPSIVLFHAYRFADQSLFGEEVYSGPVVRSDLALWAMYVLNDAELSAVIYDLGRQAADGELSPEELKTRLQVVCRERERELVEAASSQNP